MLLRLQPVFDLLPGRFRDVLALLTYSMVGLPTSSWRFRELLPQTVDLADRYARETWMDGCQRAYGFVDRPHDRVILGAMLADLNNFLGPLLRRLDRTTMAHSVECRVPFLDRELVTAAMHLPLSYRLGARADKWVLKRVGRRYLPGEVIQRSKRGFPLPITEFTAPLLSEALFRDGYLTRELEIPWTAVKSRLERGRRGAIDAFGFLTLELWGRMFERGESVHDLTEWLAEVAQ